MKKRSIKKGALIFAATVFALALLLTFSILLAFVYARKNVNYETDELLFASVAEGSVIRLYADEDLTDSVYTPIEIEVIYPGESRKEWVSYREIPTSVIESFLAMEDRAFFKHKGVSLSRTAKAAVNYLLGSRGGSFGGSTITQQVVKNISGDSEYTVRRKLSEILRAYHMEQMHSKEEILEVYLNVLPMGENTVGIGLAAERYFGKTLSELSYDEIATLVGIANAPGRYNPHTAPEACREKRDHVLYAMRDNGVIDDAEYELLRARPLSVLTPVHEESEIYSWFSETVMEELREDLCREKGISRTAAEAMLAKGGFSVYTTMDIGVQKTMEQVLSDKSRLPKACEDGLETAMVIVDSKSGCLLGIVGRAGKKNGNYLLNHALTPHIPGSALKPLALYAPLIDAGRINAATVMDDVPLSFSKNGSTFREYPKNYPSVYSGLITVKDALRLSKNTVAVRLYEMLGAEKIYHSLTNQFGFDTVVRTAYAENGRRLTDLAAAPLALGQLSYGVSLRRLTEAYTAFPSEGLVHGAKSYHAVYNADGEIFLQKENKAKRVFSIEGARLMNQLLSEVVESGTAKSVSLSRIVDTAGKTGTSGEDRDRLFVGYTPYYTAGIWIGYEGSDRSIGTVSPTHLALWDTVMCALHEKRLSLVPEDRVEGFSTVGLVTCSYCKDSGCACGHFCGMDLRGEREDRFYFLKKSLPVGVCTTHIPVYYDMEREGPATSETRIESLTIVSMLRIGGRDFPKPIFVSDQKYVYEAPAAEREALPALPLFPYADLDRKKNIESRK
ncbi:MAG: penicillin-binding protein [Clostridia bacterium]|nr:penicillin-binding protein [Clostridia bacterium]